MFRPVVYRQSATGRRMRRWMTAATSGKKRALSKQQLQGQKSSTPAAAAATTTTTAVTDTTSPLPPSNTSSPSGGTGGSMLPLAVLGLAGLGGAVYYFSNLQEPAVDVVPESTPEEDRQKTPPDSLSEADSSSRAEETTSSVAEKRAIGHRVSEVQVPPKMKNTSAAAVVPVSHPEKGHRVSMDTKKESPKLPVDDPSLTKNAIAELRDSQTEQAAQALLESHQSVWSAMDEAYFQDLDSLTPAQLKARVVQLATEMKDRTKWEAVRLKEFLAMKEKETANQYMEILQKQRLELEYLMEKRLREQGSEMSDRLHKAVQDKESTIQTLLSSALEAQKAEHEADMKAFEDVTTAELQAKLEDEYAEKMVELTEKTAQNMQQKAATLTSLTEKLSQLESALEASKSSKEGSLRAHRVSAAALALAEKLESNQGAEIELKALKAAAGRDGVIATALATIPEAVNDGVPTLSDLQGRFGSVHKKGRQAALVPAGRPGLEGQLAGIIFAAMKYPPRPDDAAPEVDKDSAEYVLARASQYVELGQLERAVEQLDKLQGQPAFTVADWKSDAMTRVALEKALKVIKMECALLNESMVD